MNSQKGTANIKIIINNRFKGIEVNTRKISKLARAVCSRFGVNKAFINIVIVDDVEIMRLNRRFLKHRGATDCLSFDLSDELEISRKFDLIINGQRAIKEAESRGHSNEAELALYITHGLLHNMGFDDREKTAAKKMHEMEDKILQEEGFGIVYG
jgi:probable rRNA maturation factor